MHPRDQGSVGIGADRVNERSGRWGWRSAAPEGRPAGGAPSPRYGSVSARALVALPGEGVTVRADSQLRPDPGAGRGPAAPAPCVRVESLGGGAQRRRLLSPSVGWFLAHVAPPVLAAYDAASDRLPQEGPLATAQRRRRLRRAARRPGNLGVPACRSPAPNGCLHVFPPVMSSPPSRGALAVETTRHSANRLARPRRHRRRSGSAPQHAGLVRPPAVLRAIPLRHPPHPEAHVGPPCPSCSGHLYSDRGTPSGLRQTGGSGAQEDLKNGALRILTVP